MPVGSELAESVESLLNAELRPGDSGPVSMAIMRSHPGLGEPQLQAMRRIRDSILSQDSIDDFLSEWREVPYIDEVAKLAIAHLVLDAERRSILCTESITEADRTARLRQLNSTWLGQILRRPNSIRRKVETILNDVAFIVFNYDRLLEQYLKLYLTIVTGKSAADADSLLQSLALVHAYGSLGDIASSSPAVPFASIDISVPMAARGIRTYNEAHPSADVAKIQKIIGKADKIVFLGCAYHEQNLQLLFGPDARADHEIFGTCIGLPERRQTVVIKRLSDYGSVKRFEHNPCSDFIRGADDEIFAA
jgi:hypothetical protein